MTMRNTQQTSFYMTHASKPKAITIDTRQEFDSPRASVTTAASTNAKTSPQSAFKVNQVCSQYSGVRNYFGG